MTSDASTSTRPFDEPTPFHKAARDGTANPQLLLEKLPAMLHGVMIQCADVFKHPARSHPRAILHTNAQMKATIPATVDRFQQALDMLEIEILKAKAVLHRDLTKFYTAAELARQKELEEEERKAAIEREAAEAERLRIQKQIEEEQRVAAEAAAAEAAAIAAAEAEANAAAAAAAAAASVVPVISTDLEMDLDVGVGDAQTSQTEGKDTDMDQLFGDMQDNDAAAASQLAAAAAAAAASHPLEMNIPLVAASTSSNPNNNNIISLDDDDDNTAKSTDPANAAASKIKAESSPTATFEDPIILDSPLLPADEGEPPSAVDLFGEDPLNPVGEPSGKDSGVGGGDMSIEEQIDMDFLFAGATGGGGGNTGGGGGSGNNADGTGAGAVGDSGAVAHETSVDDLFGDLDVDTTGDGGKLDIMSLDIPGLEKEAGKSDDPKKATNATATTAAGTTVQEQADIDMSQALGGGSFDDLLASFDLGQMGHDETSLFDDAFDIYNS
ncbi:hypothetical protein TWF730_009652 [Orbilia blumenaviensis]|uniref:Uncharacterized protein n=1 Tax=Orbilia blumenaviensis TaxID=1796055 RepID=A0AAV9UTS9_9PEZI